jgi:NitT/TauT family transport system ATP-binding protein
VSEESLITATSLGKEFAGGQAALADVDLQIEAGDFVSIVGPSGCGKSTLLRLVAGLDSPTSGTLQIDECSPGEKKRESRRTAFVFQDATLLPWRNVVENIRLPLELDGVSNSASNVAIDASLQLIGLTADDRAKFPRMLSGGMRMRVSLARALVTEPDLLLLDEPFGALDDMMRQRLNEDLLRVWTEKKPTALFVTHNVAEAVFLSQRILVMSSSPGRIVAEIPIPFEFPRPPELRATAEFARLAGEVSAALREGQS